MSRKRRQTAVLITLIGFLSLLSIYLIFFQSNRPSPKVESERGGVLAQDFTLPTLNGSDIKLSDYKGKVVFLNIWATWCPPCRDEMSSMESLYRRLKGRNFELLAVSIDRDGEKVVRPFAIKYGLTFPVLLDQENKTYRLYGLTGVPESFIIDKSGAIIHKVIGPQNWMTKEWLDFFDRIIG